MRSCSRLRWRLAAATVVALVVALSASWPSAGKAASSAGWRWPLAGTAPVLRPFQPPPTPYAAGHRGVDLGGGAGAAVLAAGAGVIGYAGSLAGRGVVTVVHGALRTTYEPVAAVVHVGQPVRSGETIGRLQPPTGHCGAGRACLHWGLLRGTVYLDPLALLNLTHPILLPMGRPALGGRSAGLRVHSGTDRPGNAEVPAPAAGADRPGTPRSPPWLPIGAAALLLGTGLMAGAARWSGSAGRLD